MSTRKILLVDDDPAVRRMLVRLLDGENYSVRSAGTGREALALAAGENFHLLLLDGDLPTEDGPQICREFSRIQPRVPIIILRSNPNDKTCRAFDGAGVCLEKPLDMERLLRSISELVNGERATQSGEAGRRIRSDSPTPASEPTWDLSWSSIS